LEDGSRVVRDSNLKKYITAYYKNLFGSSEQSTVTLDESQREDIPQVFPVENEILTQQFHESEVRTAIFQMEHNKAPGPDVFLAEFFWGVIKEDLMALFPEFHQGSLPLHSLNLGTIILLPKKIEATQIQQYRPICLLNVSFKKNSKSGH